MKRILWVTCVLLIPTLALGQAQTTGRVTGKVVDEEGNPVAGARVTFISSALQGERVLTTSDNGTFLAAILPVGPYAVEFTSTGMQPVAVSFRLGVGETVPLEVTMKKVTTLLSQPLICVQKAATPATLAVSQA